MKWRGLSPLLRLFPAISCPTLAPPTTLLHVPNNYGGNGEEGDKVRNMLFRQPSKTDGHIANLALLVKVPNGTPYFTFALIPTVGRQP